MFTPDEVLALMVGGRMVQAFTDRELAQAARQAEHKIRSVLTEPLKRYAERQPYLRQDYRNFRLDRFQSLEIMQEHFTPTHEISISYYLESVIGVFDKG